MKINTKTRTTTEVSIRSESTDRLLLLLDIHGPSGAGREVATGKPGSDLDIQLVGCVYELLREIVQTKVFTVHMGDARKIVDFFEATHNVWWPEEEE